MEAIYRDYYEILGIDRDASQEQVRKAFRSLARKYHPDVAEDKGTADDRFKELNEAYEVLSHPEKRQTYDALGPGWDEGNFFAPPPGAAEPPLRPEPSPDIPFRPREVSSPTDLGLEGPPISGPGRAPRESRTGFAGNPSRARERYQRPIRGNDVESDLFVSLEEIMSGSERQLRLRKPVGAGVTRDNQVRVVVPKGIGEGQLIRCPGLGEPGSHGGDPGDLFLRVKLDRHPVFEVEGINLHLSVCIDPWEAVLGHGISVSSLHGEISLKIPPGTQPGTRLRIRQKGLPQSGDDFGDLYIAVQVRLPEQLDREERRLWESLASKAKSKKN